MSRRKAERGGDLWVTATDLPQSPGHPFYRRLNEVFRLHKFDRFVEKLCEPYYNKGGRPSIAPGIYFRMLLTGYFEGIGSERAICWRIADSLSLRDFVGLELTEKVPNHSSLTVIRQRLDEEVYELMFTKVLDILRTEKLLKGKTIGVDATTLEANAAMRSIVRRESGKAYDTYIKELAKAEMEAEGIEEEPDAREARRRDRKRKKKGGNKEWESPTDPDAQITKMKNGSTRMGLKVEQAIDMDSGAVVAVTLHGGSVGDCQSGPETVREANVNCGAVTGKIPESVVADAGYHSDQTLSYLDRHGQKPYLAQRKQKRVFGPENQRAEKRYRRNERLNGNSRGKRLQRSRGEKVERPFQLLYDRGGLRQLFLRGKQNNRKRLLVQALAYNLGLVMAKLFGKGTPKGFGAVLADIYGYLLQPLDHVGHFGRAWRSLLGRHGQEIATTDTKSLRHDSAPASFLGHFSTAC